MVPTINELGIDQLCADDRVVLGHAILDGVTVATESAILTPAQLLELESRLANSIAHPEDVVPWEQVKAEALARVKS